MAILVLVLVAALAISQTDQFDDNEGIHALASSQPVAFSDGDEGDIGQMFGTHNNPSKAIAVIVEKPTVQAQADCYKSTELIRDLTVPYSQRSYIQPGGTFCTPGK